MRTYKQEIVSHQQYAHNLANNLIRWLKRNSREVSSNLVDAALVLMMLNLEAARDALESLYSPNPRGRKPYDPVCMLRALILMILLQKDSIPKFVSKLKESHRMAITAGFDPDDVPAVGTFYLFIDRLEDGEYRPPCEHIIKKSKLRKGKHLRNLTSEKEQRQKDKETTLEVHDSVTHSLKEELLANKDQPRANDINKLLEDILIECAIIKSAQKGLLGDTQSLTLAGDGSALETSASPNGLPSCKCRENGIYDCNHDRYYTDPTATWGYDSYRDCYYFGHTFYQNVVSTNGHDLPLSVIISHAAETDFTLSLKSLDRLTKALKEHDLDWKIQNLVYDKGHDAVGIYEYLMEYEITPIIARNERSGVYPSPTGTAKKVDENGIPICPCGKKMRRNHYDKNRGRIYYTCPVKRPTCRDGKYCMVTHTDECLQGVLCQPDTKMGPVVYVRTKDDPRLYPQIPRESNKYKRLMKLRGGCERSNSRKKVTYGLDQRPCRNAVHFLVRLFLVSIVEHAKVWLAELKKKLSDDEPETVIQALISE